MPEPGAARGGQLLFEVVDLARQAVAVAFQPVDLVLQTLAVALAPRHFLAQTCDFVVQAPNQSIAGVVGKTRTLVGPRKSYVTFAAQVQSKLLDPVRSPARTR